MLLNIYEVLHKIESGINHKTFISVKPTENGLAIMVEIHCTKDKRRYFFDRIFSVQEMKSVVNDTIIIDRFIYEANRQFKLVYKKALQAIRGMDIKKSHWHDAGAYGRCSYCGRYSDNINCLNSDFLCDCLKKNGFSGSFKKPYSKSIWCENV